MEYGVKYPSVSPKSPNSIRKLRQMGIVYTNQGEAVEAYRKVLRKVVAKETENLNKAGLLLSGGVDSAMLGFLLKNKLDLTLYTAGVKGSNDIENSRIVAKKLDVPVVIREITTNDIEEKLSSIIMIIGSSGAMQVGAGIVDFFAQSSAKENGDDVLFYGQDPDLPFGGIGEHFPQYNERCKGNGFHKIYWDLVFAGMEEDYKQRFDLDRADRLGKYLKIQFRVPYEHFDIFKIAREVDAKLFFDEKKGLWKLTHRIAAFKEGVPEAIAFRNKEHVQSGTGIFNTIESIAEKRVNKICNDKGSNYMFGVDKVSPLVKYFLKASCNHSYP
jgi:asparagine synthase (glutamine-hydrolysing)